MDMFRLGGVSDLSTFAVSLIAQNVDHDSHIEPPKDNTNENSWDDALAQNDIASSTDSLRNSASLGEGSTGATLAETSDSMMLFAFADVIVGVFAGGILLNHIRKRQ